jgi:hypothetical protein
MNALSPAHIAANEICARWSGPLDSAPSAPRKRRLVERRVGTARLSQGRTLLTNDEICHSLCWLPERPRSGSFA